MRKTPKNEVHRSRMIETYLAIGRHIYWGTKLVLSKMQPYIVRCKKHLLENTPNTCKKTRNTALERKHVLWETSHISQKKIRIQRDVRNKSHRVTNHMHFVGNETKRHSRKTGDETLRETRNETYILKNGTSQEMYGISRETWRLTSRKFGNFNKIQSKNIFLFLRRSSGFPWHTRTLFCLKLLKKKKNLLNKNVRPLWVRPLKHEANSRRFSVKCRSRLISMSWGPNPPLMLVFHHLLLSVWPHISWCQERIPPLRQQRLPRAEGWRLTR